ncbi:serine hydrolase [Falsiroseomonas ponticola]|uniref:serine hydrolase n=1 Tax=Falsiroseomonas ponticola TaxID=2786951 RepID=UPI001933CDF2|nr:serine hydrolase [Roseomonas ponticola]
MTPSRHAPARHPAAPTRRAVTAGLLSATALPTAGLAAFAPELEARVAQAARAFMERTGAPGLAIGLAGPAGRRLFFFGMADPARAAPVGDGTLFELGSLSKLVTVALAALAVEEGRLRWEDAPGRHVPEISGPGTDRLTLLHLATHCTGGMPLQFPAEVRGWADAAAWYRAWVPPAPPGTLRAYANPSIGLLGVVAARALGGDFAALARDRVLRPLGLEASWHAVPAARQGAYAQGHTRDGRPIRLAPGPLDLEAYGLRATAPDLLRLVEAQMGLLPPPAPLGAALAALPLGRYRSGALTQGAIWEWYPPPATAEAIAAGNADGMVLRPNAAAALSPPLPPPDGAFVNKTGATNGFGGYAAYAAGRGLGLVILANRNHPTAERLALALELRAIIGA